MTEDKYTSQFTGKQIDDVIRAFIGKTPGNFAPSGFGLGENCKVINDWNTATAAGWYRNTTYDPNNNSPDNFAWYGFVIPYTPELLIQVAYHANSRNVILEARRCCYSGVWGKWEWITPALQPGIEYRLAELYNGKPVYVKLVNFGALPNKSYKFVNVSDNAVIIRVSGLTSDSRTIPGAMGVSQNDIVVCDSVGSQVKIVTYADYSKITATVCAWYTKSTD